MTADVPAAAQTTKHLRNILSLHDANEVHVSCGIEASKLSAPAKISQGELLSPSAHASLHAVGSHCHPTVAATSRSQKAVLALVILRILTKVMAVAMPDK